MKVIKLPKFAHAVQAGFPSAADDFIEAQLDLNEHLIEHPSATYLARAQGSSMKDQGIFNNDTLIVDRAREAEHGDIVVAALDGELTCKILDKQRRLLLPANNAMRPVPIGDNSELIIEGVVIHSIRHHIRQDRKQRSKTNRQTT
ncbi:translesion error-prone DNA polymerase V autoproteolytic subunit [Maricurvus nonylphenolicus]|uniref:translesion error-prone DNA polymerase V autoproteolytic subunit n=1 Tax=Maricurvus nonylphenolicus TaxID=1008307 RepID=UPI0036F3AB68